MTTEGTTKARKRRHAELSRELGSWRSHRADIERRLARQPKELLRQLEQADRRIEQLEAEADAVQHEALSMAWA